MKNCTKKISRLLSLALTFVIVLSSSICVSYAAECDNSDSTFIPLNESTISFEEAIEYLGLTPEEAENVQLYVAETTGDLTNQQNNGIQPCTEVTDSSRTYINSGEVFNPGFFSFTGYNKGRYRTLNGTKAKLAFVWKPTSTTEYSQLTTVFCRYGKTYPAHQQWLYTNNPEPSGYYASQTDWIDIEKGWDYNIQYDAVVYQYNTPITVSICTIIAVY